MTEIMPADELVRRLNCYREEMAPIVSRHGGTIDNFIGAAAMAIFKATTPDDAGANAAVAAALEMQARRQAADCVCAPPAGEARQAVTNAWLTPAKYAVVLSAPCNGEPERHIY